MIINPNSITTEGDQILHTGNTHANLHAKDGSDPITPASIGAETPAGAQSKVDTHADKKTTHGLGSGYYLAKTSRTDQLPAWGDIQGKPSTFSPSSHSHPWSEVTGKPSSYTPSSHKNSHASGGSDPITPESIGAVDVIINLRNEVDLNTVVKSGFYRLGTTQVVNGPSGENVDWGLLIVCQGGDTIGQIIITHGTNKMFFRGGNPPEVGGSGTWKAWKEVETPSGAQSKVTTHENKTSTHGATAAATPNRIMMRAANGTAKVAAPVEADDIARKAEVDAVSSTLNTHINATSGIHGATSSATANSLIIRDSYGRASVAVPMSSSHIATMGYVSGAISSHANETSVHGATSSATANCLIIRDSNGRASVANPTSSSHIATKGYVDGLVGSLQEGTAFAYYLTPPNVELLSGNENYNDWWVRDETRSVAVRFLLPGMVRYHVQFRTFSPGSCDVRILLNGSKVYEMTTDSSSWQTATDSIAVNPGDIIAFQKRGLNSYWRNVRIETAQPPLGIQRF